MKIKKYFKEEGSVSTQYGDHYNFIITVDEVDEVPETTLPMLQYLSFFI